MIIEFKNNISYMMKLKVRLFCDNEHNEYNREARKNSIACSFCYIVNDDICHKIRICTDYEIAELSIWANLISSLFADSIRQRK